MEIMPGSMRQAKVASDPDTLVAFFKQLGLPVFGSGSKPGRCRNGFTPDWRRPA